jgi:hypothetical protein
MQNGLHRSISTVTTGHLVNHMRSSVSVWKYEQVKQRLTTPYAPANPTVDPCMPLVTNRPDPCKPAQKPREPAHIKREPPNCPDKPLPPPCKVCLPFDVQFRHNAIITDYPLKRYMKTPLSDSHDLYVGGGPLNGIQHLTLELRKINSKLESEVCQKIDIPMTVAMKLISEIKERIDWRLSGTSIVSKKHRLDKPYDFPLLNTPQFKFRPHKETRSIQKKRALNNLEAKLMFSNTGSSYGGNRSWLPEIPEWTSNRKISRYMKAK